MRIIFPGYTPGYVGVISILTNLQLGPLAFRCSKGVQQGDPLGPLLFSLVLLDFMNSIDVPSDIFFQLWYLDDGTFAGTRPAMAELLKLFCKHGPSFGLTLNLKKCEVFWPSGDSTFPDFPPEVCRPLQSSNGVELLGAPIFGSSEYFDFFAAALFDKVKCLQDLLPELEDPQVELQLLRQCLSCCKVVHMLRTVPPHMLHNLALFDDQLRNSLSGVVRTSFSDLTWQQATLPLRMGGLGIRQASDMKYAAYLGSCSANKELICRLLGLNFDNDFLLVGEEMAQQTFINLFTSSSSFPFTSTSQTVMQSTIDDRIYSDLHSQYSIRDRARLLAVSDTSGFAYAWLRALPSPKLGLALPPAEFVVALRLWLGIPVFPEADLTLWSCHQLIDRFGDHLIGCSHGPLRIRRHNALYDIIYYALLEDSADVRREQGVSGESASRPGDVFHPDFHNGRPTYFDISVRSAVHSGVISHSASASGFAALKGEMEKDARHKNLVEAAGGVFFPLVVDNFGVWTPSSIEVLRSIARSSTVRNGLPVSTAFHHLMERLSVQLYRYNARMILHFWALHPTWRMIGWRLALAGSLNARTSLSTS